MHIFDKHFNSIFEPELIDRLNEAGKVVNVEEGTVILEIGQTVRTIPILIRGSLKIIREDDQGRELLLYYVKAYESCAMTFTCCMQQFPSAIRVTAEEDSEIITIPIAAMDEWLTKYSSWRSYVMGTIRNRFNELLKAVDHLAFQNLDERLVHYLKEKSKITGSTLINLSHEQIANELATSRVVISRLLKKLEENKKLLLYRHQIKLLREL